MVISTVLFFTGKKKKKLEHGRKGDELPGVISKERRHEIKNWGPLSSYWNRIVQYPQILSAKFIEGDILSHLYNTLSKKLETRGSIVSAKQNSTFGSPKIIPSFFKSALVFAGYMVMGWKQSSLWQLVGTFWWFSLSQECPQYRLANKLIFPNQLSFIVKTVSFDAKQEQRKMEVIGRALYHTIRWSNS